MDIRKLQRAIVDGLEDVKAQHIVVFNTEHLSALFERVIIASGTSNRQTKALASSVRDAVKTAGFPILSTEGAVHGEWIIVDCGAAVAHIMQPTIRDYYRLEEIWGGKSVKMKIGDDTPKALPKASSQAADAAAAAKTAPGKKAGLAKKTAPGKKVGAANAAVPAARGVPAKRGVPVKTAAPARKAATASRSPAGNRATPENRAGPARKPSTAKPSVPPRKPGATKPGATKPGSARAGATKPGSVRAGATKPGATKAGATKLAIPSRRSAAAKRPAGTGGNRKRG